MPSQGLRRTTRALKRLRNRFYHAYAIKLISPLPVSKHDPSLIETNRNQNKTSETNRYHHENSCKATHVPRSETQVSVKKIRQNHRASNLSKHDYAMDN